MGKDQITNISTALMAINELSSYHNIPINIHFNAKGSIYIHVGFGTPYRKEMSFYPQDTYRVHSKTDAIYKWVEDTIETLAVKKSNPGVYPEDQQIGTADAYIIKAQGDDDPVIRDMKRYDSL